MRTFQHGYISAPWTFLHKDVTAFKHFDMCETGVKCPSSDEKFRVLVIYNFECYIPENVKSTKY